MRRTAATGPSVVGAFVTDKDVEQLQTKVRGQWTTLWTAFQSCASSGKIDPKQAQAFNQQAIALQARLNTFLTDDPSLLRAAQQMNTGEALEKDLAAWQDQLAAAGCTNLPPKPSTATEPTAAGLFEKALDVLPWVLGFFIISEFRKSR